jgi:hypothetical protein
MDYKMYQQLLKEAGDTPAPPLHRVDLEDSDEGTSVAYEFKTPSGLYIVRFEHDSFNWMGMQMTLPHTSLSLLTMDDEERVHCVWVTFGPVKKTVEDPHEIKHFNMTNEGHAFLIMAGVIAAIEDFLMTYSDYTFLHYSADGKSRVKAYNFLTRTLAKKHGMDIYIASKRASSSHYYILTNDKVHTTPYDSGRKVSPYGL